MSFELVEGWRGSQLDARIAELLAPAADAAGRAGAYVSLVGTHRAYVVCHVAQGNAATVQFSLYQATDTVGSGEKALSAVPIWSNLDTAAGQTLTRRTDAASYTTDAGLKNKLVVFLVDTAMLDCSGGFTALCVKTGASNAANVTQATCYLA